MNRNNAVPDKALCKAPWINLMRRNKRGFSPCCHIPQRDFDSFEEYRDSEWLTSIKEKLSLNDWPQDCSHCQYREKSGLRSTRERYQSTPESHTVNDGFPSYVDLRYSNICNLKCRICGPSSSHLLAKEFGQNEIEMKPFFGFSPKEKESISNFNFKNKVIERLELKGGEPMVDTTMLEFVSQLIDNNEIRQITMTTNATVYNQKLLKILEQAGNICLTLSIDGVNDTYEYIRTGAIWKTTKQNVERLLTEKVADHYTFHVVLTPYLAFDIQALLDWLMHLENQGFDFSLWYCDSTREFNSLSCLSEEHLLNLKQDLESWININGKSCSEHIFSMAKSIIESVQPSSENRKRFSQHVKILDKIRNTNIQSLDRRFSDYL